MLIALNPNEAIDKMYSEDMIQKYTNVSLGGLPPHIYAIGIQNSSYIWKPQNPMIEKDY